MVRATTRSGELFGKAGVANTRHRSVDHPVLAIPESTDDGDPDQLFAALELEEEQENRAGTDGFSADEPRPKKAS